MLRNVFLSFSTFFSRSNTIPYVLTPKVLPDETQCIFRRQQFLASILTFQLMKGDGDLLYMSVFNCFVVHHIL